MTIVGNQIAVNLDNILFATDFSPSAETARLYVQALAARYQSQVRMMHVVDLGAAFKAPDAGLSIDMFRRFGEESLLGSGVNCFQKRYVWKPSCAKRSMRPRRFLRPPGRAPSTCW